MDKEITDCSHETFILFNLFLMNVYKMCEGLDTDTGVGKGTFCLAMTDRNILFHNDTVSHWNYVILLVHQVVNFRVMCS